MERMMVSLEEVLGSRGTEVSLYRSIEDGSSASFRQNEYSSSTTRPEQKKLLKPKKNIFRCVLLILSLKVTAITI